MTVCGAGGMGSQAERQGAAEAAAKAVRFIAVHVVVVYELHVVGTRRVVGTAGNVVADGYNVSLLTSLPWLVDRKWSGGGQQTEKQSGRARLSFRPR